jgi:tRNA(Ile)-lysidine synthetase-like protein
MATEQTILEFWKSHPEWWIAIGEKQALADVAITRAFWPPPSDLAARDFLSQAIFHDQFMRHFSRIPETGVTEDAVQSSRKEAVSLVLEHIRCLIDLPEVELYFALMPLKHVHMYNVVFEQIHRWLDKRAGSTLNSYPVLMRFYNDTYKKAYTQSVVCDQIAHRVSVAEPYNPLAICDSYPDRYASSDWTPSPPPRKLLMPLTEVVASGRKLTISLSGGVDSMAMLAVAVAGGLPVDAVHIVYGNRDVAQQEASFLKRYCQRLGVTLHVYPIEWLRRATAERAFYESMTRWLRFAVYRAVGAECVLLGHIQDDVVENIWTNFAHGTHLEHLAKMDTEHIEEGVTICRPWLGITKREILEYASTCAIPYLLNTTPSWSNRGKFREHFHPAMRAQYGESVDQTVLEVAGALKKQADLIDRLLYEPIYQSWNEETRTLDVTRAVEAGLDGAGWSRILTHLCHCRLGVAKPSGKACADFAGRIGRRAFGNVIPMSRNLSVIIRQMGGVFVLQVR